MTSVGAFEAKNTLGSLLDRVEAGEEILITRHGKPAARLAPVQRVTDADRVRAHAALERMTQRSSVPLNGKIGRPIGMRAEGEPCP
jgi:prevent-host-death family protein